MNNYGDRVEYVYSDTDSFIIDIQTEDIEKEIKGPLAPYLDLSNFPPTHRLYNDSHKGELGRLKIETQNKFITEFVGLKPKMYSYNTTDSARPNNTLKGIPHYRRKDLTFEQYLTCLTEGTNVKTDVARLQFLKQHMTLLQQTKVALSSYEDKRFYFDNMSSVGYGHPDCRPRHEQDVNNDGGGGDDDDDGDELPSLEGKNFYI